MEMDQKSVAVVNEVVSNHIPDAIAFSILSKLPPKSLKRFGCVRKSWTLLFENSDFMTLYRNNFTYTSLLLKQHELLPNRQYNTLLYLLSGESVENRVSLDLPPPFQDLINYYFVLGSSVNGVLCLEGPETVLWNPATKEFKVIPPSPVEFGPHCRDHLSKLCGFGYDHVRDDYKVIRNVVFFRLSPGVADRYGMTYDGVCDEYVNLMPLWEIYSLRSNSWRKLDFEMPNPSSKIVGGKTYFEGVCHWWGTDIYSVVLCLVSFVMSNEAFFTTPMPSYMGDVNLDYGLGVHLAMLNGYVAFIYNNHTEQTTFHISILGELGVKESWTKLFVIGPLPCVENLIGLGNNGNIFFKTKDGELAWFDWSTQMVVELGIKDPEEYSQVVIYKENLESLIHIGLVK